MTRGLFWYKYREKKEVWEKTKKNHAGISELHFKKENVHWGKARNMSKQRNRAIFDLSARKDLF